jgi:type VI secretion system secreted protein Hcp
MFPKISALAAGVVLAALVHPTAATSQTRAIPSQATPVASAAFMKLGEIKGESVDSQHKDWIEIQSFSWGTSNAGRPGATTGIAAPTSPGTLTISKTMDKASPVILQRCSGKQNVPEVVVHLPSNQRGQAYMEYVLKDVFISSCTQANGRESLSFNYAKIEMKYTPAAAPATR